MSSTGQPTDELLRTLALLSPYQARLAELVSLGLSNGDIAAQLNTTVPAVKSAIHAIFGKTGIGNRVQLANLFAAKIDSDRRAQTADRMEFERLEVVRSLRSTGSINQPKVDDRVFNELVHVAAVVCETPIALLSIVEAHRLWFREEVGMGVQEAARHASFCEHAIQGSDIFEVANAACDPRFQNHTFVVSHPRARFYAGAPILTDDGYGIGTLCVISPAPHRLNTSQRQALSRLAKLATRLLDSTSTPATGGDKDRTNVERSNPDFGLDR